MLTENQLKFLPERIAERIAEYTTEYLAEVGKVLKEIGEARPTDVYKLQAIYNAGVDGDRLARGLAAVSGKNIEEIYEIYDIIAKDAYNFAEPFYLARQKPFIPYEENEYIKNFAKSAAKQTAEEYINMTQTTAFAVFKADGKDIAPLFASGTAKAATSLSDTYVKVVDYAVTKAQLGAESYGSAVRQIIDAMSQSGIKTIEYATGHKRRLDTSVRQNVLWGIKQFNQNVSDLVGKDFGADGYEISYHSHPRPSHEDMGGRQFAIGGAKVVNGVKYPCFEDEAEPLLNDYNCLHFKYPILLGISEPAYDKKELAELKEADRQTFEYEGKEYTKYEASQVQRQLETAIRTEKDRSVMAKAAGKDEIRQDAQKRINLLASKYADFSKASGLPTRVERLQVKGFRSVKISEKPFTNAKNSGIINENAKKSAKAIENEIKMTLPNAILASTAQSKLQGYLLNSNHPVGKHKARVLNSVLGYHYENWETLSDKIFDAVQHANVVDIEKTKHGVKYITPITVVGEKSKSMVLEVVWQIDNNSKVPRLITLTFDKRRIKRV